MLIKGKFALKAPIEKLWESLLDPVTLASCVPGAEKVERIDDTTYDAVVKQKVGPIKVELKFRNVLTKLEPPHHMALEGDGEDVTKLGHFKQKTTVDLKENENGEVEVSYTAHVNIVGKLASFGDRVMKRRAKEVEVEFTNNLRSRLKAVL
jgi:carbon monoxide dehydrogenase subunit G